MSPLPEGQLTAGDRLRLQNELEQIKKITEESQLAYNDAHASIPAYQQLVLTTHAQVAKAKKAMQEAKEAISTSSPSSSACSSYPASRASSPPSPSSPLDNALNQKTLEGVEGHLNLQRLEQEHADLGQKLSQALRDKAEAEETKKRLNDYIIRAKSRIKEIERKLCE
ncbi:hypothetical protein BGZ80_004116 [Entomortierella chlamydospora]|uniref:Uncharacterized protein n=1 Tax=Entomortierella chlamydospora TaxID=101097 RepID=A0A9P6MN10_9FUNG|nr:hypothetical protein BGZ80_004116 [Entomortierella chlamydospora]